MWQSKLVHTVNVVHKRVFLKGVGCIIIYLNFLSFLSNFEDGIFRDLDISFRAQTVAEELSRKRADLERTKLKTNFSISQFLASDPARHRQERIAVIEYEIGVLEKQNKELDDNLKIFENEISKCSGRYE